MSKHGASELERFHEFVGETLRIGGVTYSPEHVLDEWRIQNPTPEERAETVEALREGLEDIQSGRVQSLEEFDHEFGSRQNVGMTDV